MFGVGEVAVIETKQGRVNARQVSSTNGFP
jgi:hypothetical protein